MIGDQPIGTVMTTPARIKKAIFDGIMQALAEERAIVRPLLVDLVAFVDREHEVATNGCHYEPGKDCERWCDACKLIARVPADVLGEARRLLAERES